MPAHAVVALALFLLKDQHLLAPLVFENGGGHGSAIQQGCSELRIGPFAERQHVANRDGGAGFSFGIAVDEKNIAFGNRKLLPLSLDDRFHKKGLNKIAEAEEIKFYFMTPETVKEHFSDPRAVEHYARAAANIGLWISEEKVFQQLFKREESLLDLGCGAGRIAIGLWELGYKRLLGVDFSREMVEKARHLARLLEYGIPFRVGDATALDFDNDSFDGAIFGFNGFMQIPGRGRRQKALAEVLRVVRTGGYFVFTTHDRNNPRQKKFWQEEAERWAAGEQDPRLVEFGDRYHEAPVGCTFMHIPTREEVLEDLAAAGWVHKQDFRRAEMAKEPDDVREFSDECRFWIAQKPDVGRG